MHLPLFGVDNCVIGVVVVVDNCDISVFVVVSVIGELL